ncbi:C4-dicarboxylate transporter/malic acid transport protein [Fistulina hepatica ATCC 64428]|uniref:C4-dicarboxylate transporter/malic acid transport protein n=1 Tax=Fistulina hepatica ATCC 64428 TaxID=1128425 RepID=A0A0D7A641_9AGAR|nr:C4-dicarboxylate transporter/malic acid transport protein [Fistulina hepatica ATCC 64428]
MGTGAISILFHAFPYGGSTMGMKAMTLVFFFLNLTLFTLFFLISAIRYYLFPGIWLIMVHHPVQSLFLGTAPMGFATLIDIAVLTIYDQFGFGGIPFLLTLWALWWADAVASVWCCFHMVHVMCTKHRHELDSMTSVWLLPVVTVIVASSTGGVIAPYLLSHSAHYAMITIVISTVLVTIGLGLALMMLTTYLLRLITNGLPPGATITSVFLPLGPTGQAGFSILLLGECFDKLLPQHFGGGILANEMTGQIIYVVCVIISFVLWATASMWMVFAVLSIWHGLRKGSVPFKITAWGVIFPNGVYANLTFNLGKTFNAPFFRTWGTIYAVLTLCAWIFVFYKTVLAVWDGMIFEAPCLDDVVLLVFYVDLFDLLCKLFVAN